MTQGSSMFKKTVKRVLSFGEQSISQENEDPLGNKAKCQKHILDSTKPNLILIRSLSPFLTLCKYSGIFPVRINPADGMAVFKLGQPASMFFFFYLILFISFSIIYSPFYWTTMKSDVDEAIYQIAKLLFVCGQFLAACLTIIIVPRFSRRTANFWNKFGKIVTRLCSGDDPVKTLQCRRIFICTYRKARWSILCWLFITISSWYLWWKSFHDYIQEYFQISSEVAFPYFLNVGACLLLATLISCHVLPSIIFILLLDFLRGAYRAIPLQPHLRSKDGTEFVADPEKVSALLDLFGSLNKLVRRLGEIFGRYLIVEMSAFFTAMLTNVFAVMSGFQEGAVHWETTAISIAVNILWFYFLCEAGEGLHKEQIRCRKTLKSWTMLHESPGNWIGGCLLVDDDGLGVSAGNYFSISRKLTTQVTGSLVMYLIVMLQFKTSGQRDFGLPLEFQINPKPQPKI